MSLYARFKLGRHELPVSEMGIASPQRVAWITIPAGRDVNQDWGPGPKEFFLRGTRFRAEGGLGWAFEVDAMKDRREPVTLQIDENSWQVQCQDFRYDLVSGGGVRFELSLRELEPPETYVFTTQEEMRGVDLCQIYLTAMKALAAAYFWRGISNRIHAWLTEAASRMLELREWLKDAASLVDLPWDVLSSAKWAAGIVVGQMDLVIEETNRIFDEEPRRYTEEEEALKQALLYARMVRTKMAMLRQACEAIPRREQRYIVRGTDTLAVIAVEWNKEHGAKLHWSDIARANEITDPGSVAVGRELVIPA